MSATETTVPMTPDTNDDTSTDATVVPLGARRGEVAAPTHPPEDPTTSSKKRTVDLSPRQMLRLSRIFATLLAASWLVAWPIGSSLSQTEATGTLSLRFGYSTEMIVMGISSIALVWFLGWAIAAGLRMEATARRLTSALADAGRRIGPSPPDFAQRQISTLNTELDDMLKRLAGAESMIRQQVKALNAAGNAIDTGTAKSAERLEQERNALMELTEEMSREADRFADRIAERTQHASSDAEHAQERSEEKQKELAIQIQRLESVSEKSLDRFEQLASAMENRGDELSTINAEATERQTAIAGQIEENSRRIETAQAELATQSQRLEMLIREQRNRADRLAKVVTTQMDRATAMPAAPAPKRTTDKKKSPPKAPPKAAAHEDRRAVPWKEILGNAEPKPAASDKKSPAHLLSGLIANKLPRGLPTAESAQPTSEVSQTQATNTTQADHLVSRLHHFSLVVQTQLFGVPSHDELARFEAGERQIFARTLIAGSNEELRTLIADEMAKNRVFSARVAEFLKDFDTVLEPLATGNNGEEAVENYLTSPIGQLYIAVGAAAGHFS
ncbi:MAG: hypothetical protein ACWA5T_09570 [Parvularcula sp.]